MSLRAIVRKLLEEGRSEERIMLKLRCCRATVQKTREQMAFDAARVDEKECARRVMVSMLTPRDFADLARKAEVDPLTLRRALMGLRIRRSTAALVARALAAQGLEELLPTATVNDTPGENAH